jgi:hypothetical protein
MARTGKDAVGWFIGLIPQILTTPFKYTMLWLRKRKRRQRIPRPPKKIDIMRIESMELVTLQAHTPHANFGPNHGSNLESNGKFLEVVSSYPIITAIAEGLHFEDLVHLSLVSKDFHRAIFPRSKPAATSGLKKHSCLNGEPGACWCCKNQICSEKISRIVGSASSDTDPKDFCAISKILDTAETTEHLNHCTRYCSRCFRSTLCKGSSPRELSRQCPCNVNQPPTAQLLCGFCAKLADGVAKERVEKREKKEIWVKAAQQVYCGGCQRRLPKTGPQWWSCGKCMRECRSTLHPQWAGSAEV